MAIYEPAKNTAKKIRKALKKSFPGTKFSVRTSNYSGGSSIDVDWTDGPVDKEVYPVVNFFKGATFDGMIDLKEYTSYVDPDDGLEYSGANFIFTRRNRTDKLIETLEKLYNHMHEDPINPGEYNYHGRMSDMEEILNNRVPTTYCMTEENQWLQTSHAKAKEIELEVNAA